MQPHFPPVEGDYEAQVAEGRIAPGAQPKAKVAKAMEEEKRRLLRLTAKCKLEKGRPAKKAARAADEWQEEEPARMARPGCMMPHDKFETAFVSLPCIGCRHDYGLQPEPAQHPGWLDLDACCRMMQ